MMRVKTASSAGPPLSFVKIDSSTHPLYSRIDDDKAYRNPTGISYIYPCSSMHIRFTDFHRLQLTHARHYHEGAPSSLRGVQSLVRSRASVVGPVGCGARGCGSGCGGRAGDREARPVPSVKIRQN